MSAVDQVYVAFAKQAKVSFAGVVNDIESNVLPALQSLATNLVVIAERKASKEYDDDDVASALEVQKDAAANQIIRATNATAKAIQDTLNAMLDAAKGVVNSFLHVPIL